ncbi:tRNA pseudouridine(38-40) synthase TruA [Natroniella sulfidigena]|uniref:tRNA pseudouridine(38-40) synthase TruA n=1 Tax=Natroniella sulfidigena TaxID=723921 RepID=UPI00200B3DC5|nr:tRNA pseudouridine(38-40) synthase TruA [Natroniella sulfidigena]MCK8816176.1 tRNA pseudouridine(38-40) synthase TruA [Natroniella sulfidigena]
MRNLKCTVAYDGTNYHGFQRQNNAVTIQGEIEKALQKLIKKEVKIIGASRTDAKVHAKGQVFNCKVKSSIPTERFALALNTKLPADIVITDAHEVSPKFHARYDTTGKLYHYQIYNKKFPSPFLRNYTYHINHKLNLEAMKEGAQYLVGEYDFSSFRAAGCSAKSPVRQIYSLEIDITDHLITIAIKGSGFLYNMIRIIVGTLVEVAIGKQEPDWVKKVLLAKNRKLAGSTAPACGLSLTKVNY